jgi:hypothetical protein
MTDKKNKNKETIIYDTEAATEMTLNAMLTNAYNSGVTPGPVIEETIDNENAIKSQ